jgi:hypothetical protein
MNKVNDNYTVKELQLQYRTMNMWRTIYEKLYTRYRIRARLLELVLLISAVFLCLATFVDPKILQFFLISVDKRQTILGISSVVVLIIALLFWIINWKEMAACFGGAVDTLNKNCTECQELLKLENETPEAIKAKTLIYSSIINSLPKITEQEFYKLKAFHKRQLELNKMIDLYPGSSVWLLKILTFFQANIHVLLRKPFNNNHDNANNNE